MSLPQLNQPFHFVANVVVCMSYLRLPDILPKFAASLLLCVSSRLLEKRINKIYIFFRMRKDIAFAPSVRHLFLFNFYMNR